MKISVYKNKEEGSRIFSKTFVNEINSILLKKNNCTICLATGSSPTIFYNELVIHYKKKNIDFKKIKIFNLDEFYNINPKSKNSYSYYLYHHLLNHVNIKPKNVNLLLGNPANLKDYCKSVEDEIKKIGGIDIMILGVGMNGHIGFNEPGSNPNTVTRKVKISDNSRKILSNDFISQKDVPNEAITLGIKTILSAKKIYLLAWGTGKSDIIKKAVEEDINEKCPVSFLRKHQNVEFILDKYSTSKLNDGLQVNRN